jgi:hypothetical protein
MFSVDLVLLVLIVFSFSSVDWFVLRYSNQSSPRTVGQLTLLGISLDTDDNLSPWLNVEGTWSDLGDFCGNGNSFLGGPGVCKGFGQLADFFWLSAILVFTTLLLNALVFCLTVAASKFQVCFSL